MIKSFPQCSIGLLALSVLLVAGCNSAPSEQETPFSSPVDGDGPDATAALLEAAFAGRTELVREALEYGADVSAKAGDGRTALMLAAFDGHTETLRALLEGGARVNERDGFGRTALMYAASGPNSDSVQLLLEWKADPQVVDQEEQFTSLMFAAAEGQTEVVQALVDHGADPDRVDVDGDTALDFATRNGHQAVVRILNDGN